MKVFMSILMTLTVITTWGRPLWASDTDLFTTQAAPNILIVLDNSNSMDEDFWGNGVGSFASTSKTVVGKKALKNVIDTFKDKLRFGLMTYKLSDASGSNLHNSPYFVSYKHRSYCPNPPPECVIYAQTLDAGAKATCSTQCKVGNPHFDVNYLDEIITHYGVGSEQRNRYSNLVYPKTQRMPNPNEPGKYVYYKHAYPYYSGNNDGIGYCYSSGYNSAEGGPWDSYACYRTKTGTSDGDSVYATNFLNAQLSPTDSDYALGYLDFGRRLTWYYVGPTWHSNSSPGDGYLHVEIGDLLDNKGKNTATYTSLMSQLDPKENDPTGYMSCANGDKNTCPYVINTGLTPTTGTLRTAYKYFNGEAGYKSPIEYWCQRNFIIYVTDGLPSVDENGQAATADALMPGVLSKIDALRSIKQTLKGKLYNFDIRTYVLGVGLSDEAKPKLDVMAAHGGTDMNGHAYYADDPTQLTDALNNIFQDIVENAYSFASPSVPSVRMIEQNVVYISSFTPSDAPFWPGNIKAFELSADGTLPVDVNGEPLNAPLWVASIPTAGRVVKTYVGGALKDFTAANLNPADLGLAKAADRDALVSYVLKQDLGDIFHSNAVVVGSPSSFFQDDGYSDAGGFYDTNKGRTRAVIVGANDGMLHAFDASTGVEAWAFIPGSVLKNLNGMQKAHTYFVDSTPKVADVWFYSAPADTTKSKDEWHTVLICGLRKGGKTYFALDITDTLNPKYLWEFPKSTDAATLAKVGQSWSEPAIGKVKIERGGNLVERWVAFIGGGMDATETKSKDASVGRCFYVIDIKTGEIIWEFSYDAAADDLNLKKKAVHAMASAPSAVDTNLDGFIDRVYIGDLGGQMWVFDVSFDETTKKSDSLWTSKVKRLFTAPGTNSEKHMIYYPPAVAFDRYRIPWVYFGTGDREDPKDWNNPSERFYAVRDDGKGTYPRTEGDLKDVSSVNTFAQDSTKKGWYMVLDKGDKSLEKVLAKPSVFNHLVYFTTYSNVESKEPCSIAGNARNYVVDYVSGGGAINVTDLSQLSGTPSERYYQVGIGAPSPPVISVNIKGQASVIIGTTSGQVFSKQSFSPKTNKEPLYWREVIR